MNQKATITGFDLDGEPHTDHIELLSPGAEEVSLDPCDPVSGFVSVVRLANGTVAIGFDATDKRASVAQLILGWSRVATVDSVPDFRTLRVLRIGEVVEPSAFPGAGRESGSAEDKAFHDTLAAGEFDSPLMEALADPHGEAIPAEDHPVVAAAAASFAADLEAFNATLAAAEPDLRSESHEALGEEEP